VDQVSTFGHPEIIFCELVNFKSSFRVLLKDVFSNYILKYGLESIFFKVVRDALILHKHNLLYSIINKAS
jgi:hypothetical protein